MRELKFRVLEENHSRFVYFDIGMIEGLYCISLQCKIDFKTISEFTGLKDKNGKDIYEGDIVKDKFFDGGKEGYWIIEWYIPWACYIKKKIGDEFFIDSAELRGDWLKLAKERAEELNEKENRNTVVYSPDSESLGEIKREDDNYYDMEVVGNIYENSDLINI